VPSWHASPLNARHSVNGICATLCAYRLSLKCRGSTILCRMRKRQQAGSPVQPHCESRRRTDDHFLQKFQGSSRFIVQSIAPREPFRVRPSCCSDQPRARREPQTFSIRIDSISDRNTTGHTRSKHGAQSQTLDLPAEFETYEARLAPDNWDGSPLTVISFVAGGYDMRVLQGVKK